MNNEFCPVCDLTLVEIWDLRKSSKGLGCALHGIPEQKGGSGSGDYGHAGRPGEQGGSGPGGEAETAGSGKLAALGHIMAAVLHQQAGNDEGADRSIRQVKLALDKGHAAHEHLDAARGAETHQEAIQHLARAHQAITG